MNHELQLSKNTLDKARSIDARLASAVPGERPRVLYMCAVTPGEGTTSLVWSQAASLAAMGDASVLLVDCRRNESSLSGVVARLQEDSSTLERVGDLQPTPLENVTLVTCRVDQEERPFAELPTIIGQWRDLFNQIIVDGPPFEEISNLSSLRGVIDGVILVVESEKHRAEVLTSIIDSISSSGVPVIGTILNRKKKWIPEFLYSRL